MPSTLFPLRITLKASGSSADASTRRASRDNRIRPGQGHPGYRMETSQGLPKSSAGRGHRSVKETRRRPAAATTRFRYRSRRRPSRGSRRLDRPGTGPTTGQKWKHAPLPIRLAPPVRERCWHKSIELTSIQRVALPGQVCDLDRTTINQRGSPQALLAICSDIVMTARPTGAEHAAAAFRS